MRRMIAFALVGGLALTACSSGPDSKAATLHERRAATRASTTSTRAAFVSATTHTPGSMRHLEGGRANVHDTSCAAAASIWKVAGKVTNSTDAPASYRIYVAFLHGDTTVGIAEADPGPIAPKATARWKTSLHLATPGLRCVFRVERTAT